METGSRRKTPAKQAELRVAWLPPAAWWSMLVLVALLPLTTSITRGSMWSYTDEPYHLPKLALLVAFSAIASALWAGDVLANGRRIRVGLVTWILAGFSAIVVASTAFAIQPLSSLFGATGLMTGAVTWLLCIWLCFLLTQYVIGGAQVRQLTWALVGGTTIVAVVAILESLNADPLGTPYAAGSLYLVAQGISTTGNPAFTGFLLLAPAVVAVALALSTRRQGERIAAVAVAAVSVLSIGLTLSRGAWLGLVVAAIALVVLLRGRLHISRRVLAIAGAAMAAAAALSVVISKPVAVLGRFSLARGVDALTSGRTELWKDTLGVIARHPLLGTGADELALGAYQVQRHPLIQGIQRFVLQDPHSLPLLVAGIFGIPALIAFVALLVIVVRNALRTIGAADAKTPMQLFTGWLAAFIGLVAASLVAVWTITGMFVLFVCIAVLAAPSMRPVERRSIALGISAVVAVALIGVSAFGTYRSFAASHEVALSRVDSPPAHLERALQLVPWDVNTRTDYYWRLIVANAASLQGTDMNVADQVRQDIDARLESEIAKFPHELLFYRLRVYLYEYSKGYPVYRPEQELSAIDDALKVFPNDAEFQSMRQTVSAEVGRTK